MNWVPRRSWLLVVVGAGMLSGCVGTGGLESIERAGITERTQMTLSIQNGTTIAVTLMVNGTVIETVPAGGYQDR